MRAQFYVLAAVIMVSSIYLTARYLNEGLVVQPTTPDDQLNFVTEISTSFEKLANESEKDFEQNFRFLQRYIQERSLGSFSVTYNCSGGECPSELVQLSTGGSTGTMNLMFNITELAQPRVWWNNSYSYRVKLIISENGGVVREKWPIIVTGGELEYNGVDIATIDLDSLRIVEYDFGGVEIPFQIDQKDGTDDYLASPNTILNENDEIVFVVDIDAYEIKNLYIYYNTTGTWTAPSHSTDLNYTNYKVNNTYYEVEYNSDWSVITSVKTDHDGDGFADESNLISSMEPNVIGSYSTSPAGGILISGPIRIIIDSAVYDINSSNFRGNITRRIIHWTQKPIFEIIHSLNYTNNLESNKIIVENMEMATANWYRFFYPDEIHGPAGGWNSTVVGEQVIPGYAYAISETQEGAGFIFTDTPSNYGATEVVQWALERNGVDVISRKNWLKNQHPDEVYWESWAFFKAENFTEQPITIWEGLRDPLFIRAWYEETVQ